MSRKTAGFGLAGIAALGAIGIAILASTTGGGSPTAEAAQPCTVESLSGNWLFATGVGHFPGPEPFSGDITALGTMNIDRDGQLEGVFDATVSEVALLPGTTYTGNVTVNEDCTGTLVFETSAGSVRTDSIAIINDDEFWGMSQDPGNLWTYQARRVGSE